VRYLVTSDLHLSDRPRDEYRFGLFNWLAAKQKKYQTDAVLILGDLTDSKDRHSSYLVNRTIAGLTSLKPPVYILKGNHDYVDPGRPFFGFLSSIDGLVFILAPTRVGSMTFIPHQLTQADLDKACNLIQPGDGVFLHQTFDGAISEATGSRLSGFSASLVEKKGPRWVYSGDIHKPQRVGLISYIGSPWHCRFGDFFTPRVVLLDDDKVKNLYFEAPHKWSLGIRSVSDLTDNRKLMPGDHVKMTVTLDREETSNWPSHKQEILDECRRLKLEVFGMELAVQDTGVVCVGPKKAKSHREIVLAFCETENLDRQCREVGLKLLGGENEDR
jgi:3',5'-cyclic AMP phosphodiesterase CpdA